MAKKCKYIYNGKESVLGLVPKQSYSDGDLRQILKSYITNEANQDDVLVKTIKSILFSAQSDILDKFKHMDKEGASASNAESISRVTERKFTFQNADNTTESFQMTPEFITDEQIAHKEIFKKLKPEEQKAALEAIATVNGSENLQGKALKQAVDEITQQLKEQAEVAPLGEHIHKLTQLLFENQGNDQIPEIQKELNKIVDEVGTAGKKGSLYEVVLKDSTIKSAAEIKENCLRIAKEMYEAIVAKFDPEKWEFLSETWVYADRSKIKSEVLEQLPNGIRGRIDLVAIDKQGHVAIIDFKTSTRSFKNWYAAKMYHTEYQEGLYRAVVASNGIRSDMIGLYTLPVYIPYGKIDAGGVDKSETGAVVRDMLNNAVSSTQAAHLNLRSGRFTENIDRFIKHTISDDIDKTSPEIDAINDQIGRVLNPFERQRKAASKEALLEKVTPDKKGFVLWDFVRRKPIYAKTKEEFSKEGGLIDLYIKRIENQNKDLVETIIKQIDEFKENPIQSKGQVYDFLNSSETNLNVHQVMTRNLERYLNGNWTRIPSDKLASFGIIAFLHNTTKLIEFIGLTGLPLNAILHTGLGETVLGKFYKNMDAEKEFPALDIMESSVSGLFLIKMAAVINAMPDLFSDANVKIGRIAVINYAEGEAAEGDVTLIKDNFSVLASKGELNNNLKKIPIAELWESALIELNSLVRKEWDDVDIAAGKNYTWDDQVIEMVLRLTDTEDEVAAKIKAIQNLMLKLRQKYGDLLLRANLDDAWKATTPPQIVYSILSKMLGYYLGTDIRDQQGVLKYNLSFREILKYLTTPFTEDQNYRDKNGNEYVGALQGTYTATPTTIVSENLHRLYEYFTETFLAVRRDFNKQAQYITKITKDFEQKQASVFQRNFIGYADNIWEDLILKGEDGNKFSQSFQVKNPFENNVDLDEDQKLFLKRILWEINKYVLNVDDLQHLHWDGNEQKILENSKVKDAIEKGYYFDIPLKRARSFQELRHIDKIGVLDFFQKKWDHLQDEIDDRHYNSTIREEVNKRQDKDFVDLGNPYEVTSAKKNKNARQKMLQEQGVYDYEVDLNLLALDVAYNYIKLDKLVPLLLTADAFSIMAQESALSTGKDYKTELKTLDDYIKSAVLNRSIIDREFHEASKAISTMRRINSFMHLAGRPLQLVKELTVGTFTNFSRAWANSGREDRFKITSLFKGYGVVFGTGLYKYGTDAFGQSDWSDFTMIQQLNHEYGLANDDMNTMVIKRKYNRHGLIAGASNALYLANTAPDFLNRMVLFIAQMDHDGCFDAHTLDEDGNLHYDFSKDSRFNKLKLTGDNVEALDGNNNDEEYLKQKALYRAMMEEFIRTGTPSANGELLKFGMELPRAYTVSQRQSIKEVANLAYGFYDHEEKSLMDNMFIGLVWKQFMTFWTAKLTLWGKGRNKYTAQGQFKQKLDENGNKLYFKIIYDKETGKILSTEEVTENVDEEGNKLEPVYEWEGEYTEGLIYSIGYTLKSVLHGNFKEIVTNKQRLGNLKLALHDILIGIILLNLMKMLATGGTGKRKDISPEMQIPYMTMYRAFQEFDPINSLGSINWEPSFYSTLVNVKGDMTKFLTGDKTMQQVLQRNFGAIADFTIIE